MLTDTARAPSDAARFLLLGVAGSLGLFGLLRLGWIEAHVVLPLTRLQAALAVGLVGTPTLPVEATLACSGTDALALCLGAVLAYPAAWRWRLTGAAGGVALVLGLNTLRIGTLGLAAATPAWFDALHLYVWPAVLTVAIAGYVFAWMHGAGPSRTPTSVSLRPTPRFVVLTVVLLLVGAVGSPLYLESASVLALAGLVSRAAAAALSSVGISAHAAANVLWTPQGGLLVTQECISTPLIPVYLAAILAYATTWNGRFLGMLAALPIFFTLAVARLLVVAVPQAAGSPLFFVHAFFQLLLAAVVVALAAVWWHGRRAATGHALIGATVGVLFLTLVGSWYARLVTLPAGAPLHDPQGAIALLPAYQVGLYLALWAAAFSAAGWKRFVAGLAVLGVTQAAGLLALQALAAHLAWTVHVRDVRGWAVAGPILIFAAVVHGGRTRR